MKSIFKRKKTREKEKRTLSLLNEIVCSILSAVCEELPDEFSYLSNQLKEGLILGTSIQTVPSYKNSYRNFIHDLDILNKYEDKKGRLLIIDNIYIDNLDCSKKYKISIEVVYGLFMGIEIDTDEMENWDLKSINVKEYKIIYPENLFEKMFTENELKHLNPDDVYEVDLEEDGSYYHLFDLEDGNFIGMDVEKRVYEISHDPYEINLIENNLLTFLKKSEIEDDEE